MTDGPEPISADGFRALRQELADLRAERGAVAGTLRDGDAVGDRADEADELRRADELDRLDRRIEAIEARLGEAAAAPAPSAVQVGMGSTVTVRFEDGGESTVHLGELADADDPALVTSDSPLGSALLGRHAGDKVTYRTPGGPMSAVVVSVGG
ncbi:GreA/GreB family elongation factor [Streptomyces roseicoloratus]|uniref:GreA/GreB family elongation factor n=1 Tax=Streptomyces roseicoloratus TaxID=2508722 RepID=A0ABY9RPD0_9ACTN|nr:GreA/GreB family elongation factor [Streptomyces roseicoloratus]WMX44058.1 GreA/GreB family elongation factor [Streptomyces roseicoloratus]